MVHNKYIYDEYQPYTETITIHEAVNFAGCLPSKLRSSIEKGELIERSPGILGRVDIAAWCEEQRYKNYKERYRTTEEDWVFYFSRDGLYSFDFSFDEVLVDRLYEFGDALKHSSEMLKKSTYYTREEAVPEFTRTYDLFNTPTIDEVVFSPYVRTIMSCIFQGKTHVIFKIAIIDKESGGSKTVIHFDRIWSQTGHRKDPVVWIDVALVDPQEFTSVLLVLPGSHRLENGRAYEHRETTDGFVPLFTKKGQIAVRNAGNQHGAIPNTHTKSRITLTLGVISLDELLAYGGEEIRSKYVFTC